jgi:hypothetical protein
MTSAELVSLFKGQYKLPNSAIPINEDDVYHAGNLAQADILNDGGVLERSGQLCLVADQEEYYFSGGEAITDATNASPIVNTSNGHPYSTGDTVHITGVGGNTAANGRWIITWLTANTFSLDDSTGNGAYTSGGLIYHDMQYAWELVNVRFVNDPYKLIILVDQSEAEEKRNAFSSLDNGSRITEDTVYAYQIRDDYLRLRFLYKPVEDVIVELFYIRTAGPTEKISGTVNPIVPVQHDDVMIMGTRYHLLNNANDAEARVLAQKEEQRYFLTVERCRRRTNKRSFIRKRMGTKLIWR